MKEIIFSTEDLLRIINNECRERFGDEECAATLIVTHGQGNEVLAAVKVLNMEEATELIHNLPPQPPSPEAN